MPLLLQDARDDEHRHRARFGARGFFDRHALVVDIEIMGQPFAEFLGQAAHVGLAGLHLGLIDERPERDREIVFQGCHRAAFSSGAGAYARRFSRLA